MCRYQYIYFWKIDLFTWISTLIESRLFFYFFWTILKYYQFHYTLYNIITYQVICLPNSLPLQENCTLQTLRFLPSLCQRNDKLHELPTDLHTRKQLRHTKLAMAGWYLVVMYQLACIGWVIHYNYVSIGYSYRGRHRGTGLPTFFCFLII